MSQQRSLKKLLYIHPRLLARYFLNVEKTGRDAPIYTMNRASVILPEWEGRKAFIHNGKDFKETTIKHGAAWKKFGELSFTHKLAKFRKKEKVVGKKNFR
jgi:ribosomal protein S19